MTLHAPITAVTVLEDRASITRKGSIALAGGQHRFTIEGVSPVLADKTLTATATGARVLDIRCERYMAPWRDPAAASDAPPAKLRAERVTLEAERDAASSRLEAAKAEIEAVGEVVAAALRDLAIGASRGIAADAQGQLAELDALEAAARARQVDAELVVADKQAAIARLDARIARAEREAGHEAARLVVDLVADHDTDALVTIGYIVPGAAWRPYHRATLDRTAKKLVWETTACVWQATGEDWTDAALTFSLERPSLGIEPPDLVDDTLRARRRPDQVTVEAREQELESTGLGGTSQLEVPGIDDGGIGLTLSAPKATIATDGAPHRVPVGGFTSDVELALVAIPLRSPWVHVRARSTNAGTVPLLAGPVDLIMASGYVGRAEIELVAPGETFDVGFGPDADLRAHRTETRERDDAGLLGGWNVQTIRVAIRLSNLGTEARSVTVTERVPISEVEQVEIKLAEPDAYLLGTDDQPGGEQVTQITQREVDAHGMVSWAVELPPLGRRAVALEYRVRSQRNVAGL